MAEIPLALQTLLTQEAYLIRSKERMIEGRRALQGQLDSLAPPKKALFNFSKKKDPALEAYERSKQELEEALEVISKGADYADQLLAGIRPQVEEGLEDLLRMTSPEYRRGLAAKEYESDIIRCLRRFRERVADFRKAVGIARNSMAASYESARKAYRDHALLDLEMAAKIGNDLEKEIDFFNEIAAQHEKEVNNTAFEDVALPRLREFPYESWLRTQAELGASEVQTNFDKILRECDDLLLEGIGDLFKKIQKATEVRKQTSVSFVHNYWKILRDYACKTWVNEAKLEDFIGSLESGMTNALRGAE
jgi:hypothetical protein